jgi:hypothetical protein
MSLYGASHSLLLNNKCILSLINPERANTPEAIFLVMCDPSMNEL